MSVAAPPMPPMPEQMEVQPQEKQLIGPQNPMNRDAQDRHAPMKNLPPIPHNCTTAEAAARRQVWKPPSDIIHGEFVFYRPQKTNDELVGWVLRTLNKTYSLWVQQKNGIGKEITSVAYYDHTDPQPEVTGDPAAATNNNGTFRRTEFGRRLSGMLAQFQSLLNDVGQLKPAVNQLLEMLAKAQPAATPAIPAQEQEQPKPTEKSTKK